MRLRRRKLRFSKKLLYFLPILFFFCAIFGFLVFTVAFAWVAKDLPSPNKVVRREGFATKIFDRNNEPLYAVYREEKRIPVSFSETPEVLRQATVAIEDKEFYRHPGFSARGILRAIFNIIFHHRLQGGSTLTQQLVKNVLLTSERTVARKLREFILALQIEKRYTKDEILQMYLNEAPYGGSAWGIGAAAEQYFSKPVAQLSLAESAILAGLPQRPSAYSPFEGDLWKGRTKAVLINMVEENFISEKEKEEALSSLDKIVFNSEKSLFKAPHFVMYVKEQLSKRFGEELVEQGGLQVVTTLDWKLQQEAEKAVKENVEKAANLNISNGAAVVLKPESGEILAMVGSKDYFNDEIGGKFNVITQGLRQPGSAIKPVTYVTALKKGYTAAKMIMDTETVFPVVSQKDYIPVNYDGKYHGPMQVRFALGNSINVPAVKMLATVGLEEMLKTCGEMGISTLTASKENLRRLGFSVTLGGGEVKPLELADAYLAFANGGIKREPLAILSVKDRDGKTLYTAQEREEKRVLSEGEAFLISDILSDNNARLTTFGITSGLVISNKKVAVKTGTTNDKRDNWAVGWTPNILVLSWVGNNDNSAMKQVASGISGATPIWRQITISALNIFGYKEFVTPVDIVSAEIDAFSGFKSHDGFPSRMEYFIKGTEPTSDDPIHKKLKICRQSGKLATPPQVARGEYEEKEFLVFKEEDPVSQDGKNRWQEGVLKWIGEHDDPRYHPPEDYCEGGGVIEVAIDSPAHESTVTNSFPVVIKAKGLKKISEVKIFVNNEIKKTFDSKPYELNLNLPDGVYTLKVIAKDEDSNTGEREAKIGVNLPFNWSPSPTPTQTLVPSPTFTPTPTLTLTIIPAL